jgi:hypothetical protein
MNNPSPQPSHPVTVKSVKDHFMNTRFPFQTGIVIALSALPLLTGCTQQSAGNTPAYVITSNTPPPPAATAVPAAPVPATAEMPLADVDTNAPASAPEPIPVSEPVVPANLRLTTSLNEIIRLTHSGVDESVILTYITNSPAMFLLGAEEIVYLNDLGVTSPVITAMLQRDQTLKAAWRNPVVAETPTNPEPVAVAPTYVEPPQQAAATTEAPAVQVSNNYFYDNLSPYGAWVDVDGYGRVWRPTVVVTNPGWQPYRDRGRWIYSDAGYYWLSDYSWGSITFHYGRWFSHPRWGWCWWPDTVWAPSWVTWRYDNSYCGWAPLPPRSYYRHGGGFYYYDRRVSIGFDFGLGIYAYTYVPWSRFHDPRPYYHCLPRARSVAIHRQTTVVNDYGSGNNNTVINRGIPKDRVREHTRTEVRPVAVRAERSNSLRPARLERDGRTLVVNRPALPVETKLESPTTAGERGGSRLVNSTAPASSLVTSPNRTDRSPRGEIPRDSRSTVTAPVTSRPAPITSPATPVVRPAPRDGREVGYRNDNNNATDRSRPAATPVARPTESTPAAPVAAPTPTPARTPTPIFSKPVVIQTTPQLPNRPFVSPTPAPTRPPTATPPNRTFNGVTSGVTPRDQGGSASRPSNSWQNNNESRPDLVNRATPNQSREENSVRPPTPDRPGRSIAIERSSRSEQNVPAIRPQAPSVSPRSSPSPAPARPSFTPPSNPQPAPRIESRSQPAPRVESRPPAASSRAESSRPSNPGSDSRPSSSPGNGNQRSR